MHRVGRHMWLLRLWDGPSHLGDKAGVIRGVVEVHVHNQAHGAHGQARCAAMEVLGLLQEARRLLVCRGTASHWVALCEEAELEALQLRPVHL